MRGPYNLLLLTIKKKTVRSGKLCCLTLSHIMLTFVPLQLHLTDFSFPIPAILSSSDLGLQCCLASLNVQKFMIKTHTQYVCMGAYKLLGS